MALVTQIANVGDEINRTSSTGPGGWHNIPIAVRDVRDAVDRWLLGAASLGCVWPMSEPLIFMMGNYEARVPTDRWYSENHLWLQTAAGGFRVGFTAYSVRMLQDVYFLDWSVDAYTPIRKKQEIGQIESSKAVSSLYAPAEGKILDFNPVVLNDPSAINTDGYGTGWLYNFDTIAKLLTAEEYVKLLDSKWIETQRIIKGQMND